MIYIDLPPDAALQSPTAAASQTRAKRPKLTGKQTWRRDGLRQHLVEPTVVAETAALLEQQTRDIHAAFKPRNGWQDWLTSTIATLMLRINRSERIERKLRDWASYRAIDFWEDDQKLAVETLVLRIGREPSKVVAKLRETPAGIDWLLARWRFLARVEPNQWGDDRRELAASLVAGDLIAEPASEGFVSAQIDDLEALRERVVEADAIIRGLVEADLHDDGVPGLAKLRRYVRSLHRQLKWYVDQFHVEHPDRWDDPRRRPAAYGPVVEAYRPPNPNHFEGATPEPASAVIPKNDETKPLRPDTAPEINETKPFEPPTPAATRFTIEPPAFVPDYAEEKGRHHSRPPRPGEPSREYARRAKAARRRTNLALAELI